MKKLTVAATIVALACSVPFATAQQTARTANLNWGAVTKDVEGNTIAGVTYNVYQGARGGAKTKVRTGLTALTAAITGLAPGETCWQLTAQTVSGGESAFSNEACKSFAFPAPEAPVLTVN